MKSALSRLLVAACAAALASLPVARAQAPAAPGVSSAQAQVATFKKEEIEQLVAPIAHALLVGNYVSAHAGSSET